MRCHDVVVLRARGHPRPRSTLQGKAKDRKSCGTLVRRNPRFRGKKLFFAKANQKIDLPCEALPALGDQHSRSLDGGITQSLPRIKRSKGLRISIQSSLIPYHRSVVLFDPSQRQREVAHEAMDKKLEHIEASNLRQQVYDDVQALHTLFHNQMSACS